MGRRRNAALALLGGGRRFANGRTAWPAQRARARRHGVRLRRNNNRRRIRRCRRRLGAPPRPTLTRGRGLVPGSALASRADPIAIAGSGLGTPRRGRSAGTRPRGTAALAADRDQIGGQLPGARAVGRIMLGQEARHCRCALTGRKPLRTAMARSAMRGEQLRRRFSGIDILCMGNAGSASRGKTQRACDGGDPGNYLHAQNQRPPRSTCLMQRVPRNVSHVMCPT